MLLKELLFNKLKHKHVITLKKYISPSLVDKCIRNNDFDKLYFSAKSTIDDNDADKDKILRKIFDLRVRKEIFKFKKNGGDDKAIGFISTTFIILGVISIFL